MPKLVRNLVRRGKSYYFRQMVNGRIVRVALGNDYQEAVRRLRSLKNKPTPAVKVTLEEVADRWLGRYVTLHRRPPDHALARTRLRQYLVPCLGHLLLGRLTAEDCRSYRLWLEKKSISRQTVRHLLSDLRCLLNWCADTGLMDHSPFPRRLLPRVQERPPDRLTEEELETVCSLPDPHGFVCWFLVGTGLRWGEATRAQVSDVHGGLLVVHQTKSGKVRRVPVPPGLLEGRIGRIVPFSSHGAFNRRVQGLSGVERFHAHRLRHSFACRWLEAGGSLAALQEILGHSTIVTTQRYARLGEAHVQEEARRVFGKLVTKVVTGEMKRSSTIA